MFKKKILIAVFCSAFSAISSGQDVDSLLLSNLKLNFAVPDCPAFKTLGTDPSEIMKPSTPKALAISMSQFYSGQKIIIPKAFAMEISPALLINSKKGPQGLADYRKHSCLNSFRISLGTSNDTVLSASGRSLSIGFRITPINKGDIVTDEKFLVEIAEHLRDFRLEERTYQIEFAKANLDTIKEFNVKNNLGFNLENDLELVATLREKLKTDSVMQKKFDDYKANSLLYTNEENFDKIIEKVKEKWKRENWNATKLDIAAALLSSSPDSLVKNIQFNSARLWVTSAFKAGKSAQLMVGLTGAVNQNITDTSTANKNKIFYNVTLPVRYLVGTNRVKGFIECQDKYEFATSRENNKLLLNLGAELNIADGLWINVYGGLQDDTSLGSTSFVANMNIKITLPEKFKLF